MVWRQLGVHFVWRGSVRTPFEAAFPRWRHSLGPGQFDSIAVGSTGTPGYLDGTFRTRMNAAGSRARLDATPPACPHHPKRVGGAWLVNPQTGVERTIHVPAPGPLTAVAVHDRFVWLIDPYHRCLRLGGVRRCKPPRLIRYNRKTGSFLTFIIPRRFSLRPLGSMFYYNDAMIVGRDGTVWTLILNGPPRRPPHPGKHRRRRFVLLGFRHGVFFEVHLWPWWFSASRSLSCRTEGDGYGSRRWTALPSSSTPVPASSASSTSTTVFSCRTSIIASGTSVARGRKS